MIIENLQQKCNLIAELFLRDQKQIKKGIQIYIDIDSKLIKKQSKIKIVLEQKLKKDKFSYFAEINVPFELIYCDDLIKKYNELKSNSEFWWR